MKYERLSLSAFRAGVHGLHAARWRAAQSDPKPKTLGFGFRTDTCACCENEPKQLEEVYSAMRRAWRGARLTAFCHVHVRRANCVHRIPSCCAPAQAAGACTADAGEGVAGGQGRGRACGGSAGAVPEPLLLSCFLSAVTSPSHCVVQKTMHLKKGALSARAPAGALS